MAKLGIEVTYSSDILIREVALNILLVNRIKSEIICRGLLRNKEVLKKQQEESEKWIT